MPHFAVSRVLPYRREALFDIAADVERYPEFLPGWLSASIRRREDSMYVTDQVVGFGPIQHRFTSTTVLKPPEAITVTSVDPTFESFALNWTFEALADDSSKVALSGGLELRAPLLGGLFSRAAVGQIDAILAAFEARARALLG
jgi:coenzyme Q-binding protein COQ10